MNDYDNCLLAFFESFIMFPDNQAFVILVSWEKSCQLIAGPKEMVEYLIDGDCKASWQKLSESWFYEDPDRNYDDLRQFAKDLGYFDGPVSRD